MKIQRNSNVGKVFSEMWEDNHGLNLFINEWREFVKSFGDVSFQEYYLGNNDQILTSKQETLYIFTEMMKDIISNFQCRGIKLDQYLDHNNYYVSVGEEYENNYPKYNLIEKNKDEVDEIIGSCNIRTIPAFYSNIQISHMQDNNPLYFLYYLIDCTIDWLDDDN